MTTTPSPLAYVVDQSEPAALLAAMLCTAAEELWDAATLDDPGQMWEDARYVASRILAACPID